MQHGPINLFPVGVGGFRIDEVAGRSPDAARQGVTALNYPNEDQRQFSGGIRMI
ncbi:hypothetical protein [Bradyrhizobium sp. USDA 4529]